MANVTMTNRDFLNAVLTSDVSEELKDFAQVQLQKMDEKNAKRKSKESKTQKANAEIKNAIVAAMEQGTAYTAANIAEIGIEGITSTQKASSLLRQLAEDGTVTVTEIKVKGKGKVKGYTLVNAE